MSAVPPVRPDLELTEGYHSPQVDAEVRLNTNESPFPPPEKWGEELLAALAEVDPATLKIRERIRRGVLAWLDAATVDEAATRRWTGFLALPTHAPLGLRLAWETADKLWVWAGDRATDENHYSKRALLAGILIGTLAVRLADGPTAAEDHLDRRIQNVMDFERLKGRLGRFRLGVWAAEAAGRLRYGRL